MADKSYTSNLVRARSNATISVFTAGAALKPGDWLYQDSSDNKVKKSVNTSAAAAACIGMALGYADDTDRIQVATGGTVDPGFTATRGQTYEVSSTAGLAADIGDAGNGDYVTHLGVGRSDGDIDIRIFNTGILVSS